MLRQTEDQSLKDLPQSIVAEAINLSKYRGNRRSRKGIRSAEEIASESSQKSPVALAVEYYIKEKFSGNLIAQILAKANIEQDYEFATVDETGRFKDFRLAESEKNAQLQCWELFPYAIDESNQQRALMHQQGYSLLLKSLGFMEDDPETHSGLRSIVVTDPIDGLTETEQNRLNALILVSLNDRQDSLSQWERTHYFDALKSLSRLFGC